MKKSLKRITTTLAACILAVAPVNSMANVNAATEKLETYRVYVDSNVVPHAPYKPYQADLNLTFSSHKNIKHCGSRLPENCELKKSKGSDKKAELIRNGSGTQIYTHSFFEYHGYADEKDGSKRNLFNFTCTKSKSDTDSVYYIGINADRDRYPQLNKSTTRPCSEYRLAEILVGDISGNGIVDSLDLSKLYDMVYHANNLTGPNLCFGDRMVDDKYRAADIDNNGRINSTDYDLLYAYVYGSRTNFGDTSFAMG